MPSSDETFERSLSTMEDTSADEAVRVQAVLVLARQRQADFYVALQALWEANRDGFDAGMRACANSPNGILDHEHYLARWEVQRHFPEPAFP